MAYYLQVEFETSPGPDERYDPIVRPLIDALGADDLGQVLFSPESIGNADPDLPEGTYEIANETSDTAKARHIVERILKSAEG